MGSKMGSELVPSEGVVVVVTGVVVAVLAVVAFFLLLPEEEAAPGALWRSVAGTLKGSSACPSSVLTLASCSAAHGILFLPVLRFVPTRSVSLVVFFPKAISPS